jgi:hypothetical protein
LLLLVTAGGAVGRSLLSQETPEEERGRRDLMRPHHGEQGWVDGGACGSLF